MTEGKKLFSVLDRIKMLFVHDGKSNAEINLNKKLAKSIHGSCNTEVNKMKPDNY